MCLSLVFWDKNHIKEAEFKTVTQKEQREMLGIKEKRNEGVGMSISHGVIVLSVAGVMNPISQAAPVSFRSCRMQIHGPLNL